MDSSSTSLSNNLPSWNLSHKSAVLLIQDITNILAEFSWVYSTRNTEIFVHNVLEKIPSEWVDVLSPLPVSEYTLLPYGFIKDDWPLSLKSFLVQCNQLADLRFPKYVPHENTAHLADRNMPLKKRTEIAALSNLVHHICKEVKCHKVLDIGSGLGYLDKFLHHNFGLQCVGLDSVEKLTNNAKCRLEGDPCINSIKHETMLVENSEDSIGKLQIILKNAQNIKPTCSCECSFSCDSVNECETAAFVMVGLHCCGNLMQNMMKIFCHMNELKAFVCMGCCYNKINLDDFPMSEVGQNTVTSVQKKHSGWSPCISGLRLGTHATRANLYDWTSELLQNTENGLIYRGLIEVYINQENITWKKPKRRVKSIDLTDFEKFCDVMFQTCEPDFVDQSEQRKKLNEIYLSKKELFPRVKVLLILQILLQPLWECFVLLDRMLYFQEKSIVSEVYAVWDDSISPRNLALCAYKN